VRQVQIRRARRKDVGMPDDTPDELPSRDYPGADLGRGVRLWEQLKNVHDADAAYRAVYEGALDQRDLRAIVLQRIYEWRQVTLDADGYGRWMGG
jgi:hypothetical protein